MSVGGGGQVKGIGRNTEVTGGQERKKGRRANYGNGREQIIIVAR